MQKSNEYSESLRQQIVQEVLSGKLTKTEATRSRPRLAQRNEDVHYLCICNVVFYFCEYERR